MRQTPLNGRGVFHSEVPFLYIRSAAGMGEDTLPITVQFSAPLVILHVQHLIYIDALVVCKSGTQANLIVGARVFFFRLLLIIYFSFFQIQPESLSGRVYLRGQISVDRRPIVIISIH